MDRLLLLIEQDAGATPYQLVFLGDYIDRGPDSRAVIDRLIELTKNDPSVVVLRGNHEDYLEVALTNKNYNFFNLIDWCRLGAKATLESYGIDWTEPDVPAMMRDFRAAAGQEHIDFVRGLRSRFETANYIFDHTGEGTLMEAKASGRTLIQGHIESRTNFPDVQRDRILVDTGAYRTGRLSAAVLDPGQKPRFIMTG